MARIRRAPAAAPSSSAAVLRFRRLAAAWVLTVALPAVGAPLTLLTEENPPFNYSVSGKLTGIVADLVVEAAVRAQVPYAIEVLPWASAYARAQAEPDTCLFATARLPSREKLFVWVGPVASNRWAVYGRGDFAGSVRALADVKRLRVGGVAGDAKVEYLKRSGVTDVREVPDDRMNPPRLYLPTGHPDRIDLWVAGYYSAREVARTAQVPDVKLVLVVREIPLYLACSPRTAPATVRALVETVDAMRAEGVPARVAAAYGKKFAPQP